MLAPATIYRWFLVFMMILGSSGAFALLIITLACCDRVMVLQQKQVKKRREYFIAGKAWLNDYALRTGTLCTASLISLIRDASFSIALPTTITSAPALQFR